MLRIIRGILAYSLSRLSGCAIISFAGHHHLNSTAPRIGNRPAASANRERESRGRIVAPSRQGQVQPDSGKPCTIRSGEHGQPPRPRVSSALVPPLVSRSDAVAADRVRISSNRVCGIVHHAAARSASVRGAVRVSVRVGSCCESRAISECAATESNSRLPNSLDTNAQCGKLP